MSVIKVRFNILRCADVYLGLNSGWIGVSVGILTRHLYDMKVYIPCEYIFHIYAAGQEGVGQLSRIVRTKQTLIWKPLAFFFSSGWERYFQHSSSTQSSICFLLSRFDLHFQPWNYKQHTGPFSTPSSREIWNMIFLNLWQIFASILSCDRLIVW